MKLTLGNSLKSIFSRLLAEPGKVLQGTRNTAYHLQMKSQVMSRFGVAGGGIPVMPVSLLVPALDEEVKYYTYKPGTSLAIEIAIFKALAQSKPGFRFLEIGSYLGEAIRNIADTGAECVSLSLGDADMVKLGFGAHIPANRFFIKNVPNIRNIDANTHTYDFSGLGKFDMVFIDGDHTYEGVLNDTQKVMRNVYKDDTIVFWHDYSDKAGVRWIVLSAILEGTPRELHDRIYYIENTQTAVLLPKSFPKPDGSVYDPTKPPAYSYDMRVMLRAV